jgi:hypothetical protein
VCPQRKFVAVDIRCSEGEGKREEEREREEAIPPRPSPNLKAIYKKSKVDIQQCQEEHALSLGPSTLHIPLFYIRVIVLLLQRFRSAERSRMLCIYSPRFTSSVPSGPQRGPPEGWPLEIPQVRCDPYVAVRNISLLLHSILEYKFLHLVYSS